MTPFHDSFLWLVVGLDLVAVLLLLVAAGKIPVYSIRALVDGKRRSITNSSRLFIGLWSLFILTASLVGVGFSIHDAFYLLQAQQDGKLSIVEGVVHDIQKRYVSRKVAPISYKVGNETFVADPYNIHSGFRDPKLVSEGQLWRVQYGYIRGFKMIARVEEIAEGPRSGTASK